MSRNFSIPKALGLYYQKPFFSRVKISARLIRKEDVEIQLRMDLLKGIAKRASLGHIIFRCDRKNSL